MPCLSTSSYYKQVDSILGIAEDYTKEELISAGQRLRNIILDENPELDINETLDAAVSFDGTWALARLYLFDRGSLCNLSRQW